jgi:hypothetical protein
MNALINGILNKEQDVYHTTHYAKVQMIKLVVVQHVIKVML